MEELLDVPRPDKVVVVLGRKGGVGKTSVVVSLAKTMASQGLAVGVLDADLSSPTLHEALLPPGLSRDIVYGKNYGWSPVSVLPVDGGDSAVTEGSQAEMAEVAVSSDAAPVTASEDSSSDSSRGSLKVFSVAMLLPPDQPSTFAWLPHRKRMLIEKFMQHVLWGKLDVLLIDTPPGVGEVHSTLLSHIRSVPNSSVLLVAEDGLAASLAATRADVAYCNSQRARVAGIVGTRMQTTAVEAENPDDDEDGVESQLDDLAADVEVPVVARLTLLPGGRASPVARVGTQAPLDGLAAMLQIEASVASE